MTTSRRRFFDSSVGTKLLIGVTGLALFLYLIIHIAGNLMVFLGPDAFNELRAHADQQPAASGHRDRAAARLPDPHLQDRADVPRQPAGAAGRATRRRSAPGAPSRKTLRLVDDDRLRALAAGLRRHSRQDVQVRRRVRRPADGVRDLYRLEMENFANPLIVALLRRSAWWSSARTSGTASRARSSRSASTSPRWTPRILAAGKVIGRRDRRRLHRHRPLGATSSGGAVMTLDAEDSGRPARRQVGPAQVRDEAGQPGQQAQVHDHRRRHRPGRRVGGRVARRAGLQRPELLHPGQPAPRAQHRRAGRHQRREELPERRRQRLPPVLRHGQGRRLPRRAKPTSTGSRS